MVVARWEDEEGEVVPNHGRFGSADAALDHVVSCLVRGLDPLAIYLFGSRARGDARPDSDFDLLVVLPDEAGDLTDDYDYVAAPLIDSGIGCDVVPVSQHCFQENRDDPTTLTFQSVHHGRKLYER